MGHRSVDLLSQNQLWTECENLDDALYKVDAMSSNGFLAQAEALIELEDAHDEINQQQLIKQAYTTVTNPEVDETEPLTQSDSGSESVVKRPCLRDRLAERMRQMPSMPYVSTYYSNPNPNPIIYCYLCNTCLCVHVYRCPVRCLLGTMRPMLLVLLRTYQCGQCPDPSLRYTVF